MPDGLWSDYGTEAAISVGAALLTALGIRFRLWARGEAADDAPLLRQFLAYLAAYAAAFAAIRTLEGFWRYVILVIAASLAFAVTINGPAPLFSSGYVRNVAIAFAGILVLVALYALLLLLFGVDLLASHGIGTAAL
jgi:hypothetical protein